jgi:hypothetical protein
VSGGSGNRKVVVGSKRTVYDKPTLFPDMTAARRFSGPDLVELAKAKILGVRAGAKHRYTGVWVVVVERRVFVRSWGSARPSSPKRVEPCRAQLHKTERFFSSSRASCAVQQPPSRAISPITPAAGSPPVAVRSYSGSK